MQLERFPNRPTLEPLKNLIPQWRKNMKSWKKSRRGRGEEEDDGDVEVEEEEAGDEAEGLLSLP